LVRNPDKKYMNLVRSSLDYLVTHTKYTCLTEQLNATKYLLESYNTPTLVSFLTEEVLHINNDFRPDLLGGDGRKIADREIFLD